MRVICSEYDSEEGDVIRLRACGVDPVVYEPTFWADASWLASSFTSKTPHDIAAVRNRL